MFHEEQYLVTMVRALQKKKNEYDYQTNYPTESLLHNQPVRVIDWRHYENERHALTRSHEDEK